MNRFLTGQIMAATLLDHGCDINTREPMALGMDLAIAVSLQGRYRVRFDYYGNAHKLRVTVRLTEAEGAENPDGLAPQPALFEVALPTRDTDAQQCRRIRDELERINDHLSDLLLEGQPS
ncbi:hypothetical protein [Halomonas organivorans]|uniref:Uncharacterized protein n=1 Tax=Halomonas organivorans TaxID=257772 RepID=A0A7W5G7R0_9GAMM|nr:hypothetical protein [Halomonas organivorans]MBB3142791.1 hypothetical protein [Halomonas organivorans]